MALKIIKPTTASRRSNVRIDYRKSLTEKKPERTLTTVLNYKAGRAGGKISMRHKGGRVKQRYRIIDFKRGVRDIEGKVASIEYDPNRNVFISLIIFANGIKSYILTPEGLKVGDKVMAGDNAPINVGNALPLNKIPVGTQIHNLELNPGSGGVMARSAGNSATLMGFDQKVAQIKLPSKEMRLVNVNCYATIGTLSNADFKNTIIGKAGRNRHRGFRPSVRGMVMPPSEHPHGGGEAKGVIGHVAKDKWGNVKGKKTRRSKHRFTKNILVNRKGQKVKAKK